jgi:hypothetical protein
VLLRSHVFQGSIARQPTRRRSSEASDGCASRQRTVGGCWVVEGWRDRWVALAPGGLGAAVWLHSVRSLVVSDSKCLCSRLALASGPSCCSGLGALDGASE